MNEPLSAQELAALIRAGTATLEKPELERQLDAICNALTGLVGEHQRLSIDADRSKNAYKKKYAITWAGHRAAKHDHAWTAKDIEQATVLDTSVDELIADMDDTLAKSQGELIDVMKMVLAGKRSVLQSVLAEYHNGSGEGGKHDQ
jgi:hypothetical protein